MKYCKLILLCVIIALSISCSEKTHSGFTGAVTSDADLIGKDLRFAMEMGAAYEEIALEYYKAKEVEQFAKMPDLFEALSIGRVDVVIVCSDYVKPLQDSRSYPNFQYIPVPKDVYIEELSPIFSSTELRDKYNEWLATVIADGSWQALQDFWLGRQLPETKDITKYEFTGENGILRLCDTGNYPPYTYFDENGTPVGFNHEMANRFAQYLGMKPQYEIMDFVAIIPYVQSGKADMSSCFIVITPERQQNMIFSDVALSVETTLVVVNKEQPAQIDYTYFSGKKIGMIVGTLQYDTILKIGGEPVTYNDFSTGAEDVHLGRIAGFCNVLTTVQVIANELGRDKYMTIPIPREIFVCEIAAISHSQEHIDRFNGFLRKLKADGTLEEMQNRWFREDLDLDQVIPSDEFGYKDTHQEKLRVATCTEATPYVFARESGHYSGFSIELMLRYGAYLGISIEFINMEFSATIPYVASHKADMGISYMAITEERKKSVLFTDPFTEDHHGILALREIGGDGGIASTTGSDGIAATGDEGIISTALNWVKRGIERNLKTDNRWKMVLEGLGVTMTIAFFAQIFGTLFGCLICFILLHKTRYINWFGRSYCRLIYGTPIVVLLMITYYIIFGNSTISNVVIAICAFTMTTGASVSQLLKSTIETIDPVEIEAARSLGFSRLRAFMLVTLPQAVRRALPAYTNGFVELVKATAIVGYIAIQDLTRAGDIIRSRTYDAYFPLLFVALIYLIVTTICVELFKYLVRKINTGESK